MRCARAVLRTPGDASCGGRCAGNALDCWTARNVSYAMHSNSQLCPAYVACQNLYALDDACGDLLEEEKQPIFWMISVAYTGEGEGEGGRREREGGRLCYKVGTAKHKEEE